MQACGEFMTLFVPAMGQSVQMATGGMPCRDRDRPEGGPDGVSRGIPGGIPGGIPSGMDVPSPSPATWPRGAARMASRACGFIPGTLLRTPSGDVPVESLGPGDCVLAASGQVRRICWIGLIAAHRPPAGREGAYLVHIAAHACARGRPARDLIVLPDMAVGYCMHDEVLVPARELTNGATIATVPGGVMECWGIVLDHADVVLANGLPVGVGMTQAPTEGLPPVLTTRGPLVAARRAGLVGRAQDMGWRVTTCMDVHAMIDGRRHRVAVRDGVARFTFAPTARHVRMVSRTFVPADWATCDDRRALGLAVQRITLGDGARMTAVDLSDPRIAAGFHVPPLPDVHGEGAGGEGVSWRWTKGVLSLPCDLWRDIPMQDTATTTGEKRRATRGHDIVVCVEYDPAASQCWVLPAPPLRIFRPETAAARHVRGGGGVRHCVSGAAASAS
ncbi:hypothetical protein Gaha_0100_014 [Novacetimonas hansenii JCM 7643]|nr:hypothetical protein Gaha_0100_014 [Novacetimonas hansenii JCM 7643]